MGFLATVVVGLIAGLLAHWIMKTKTGLILGQNLMSGINLESIIVALVGAVIVIAIYRLITRGRA